jgi:hypothetical protein
MATVRLVPITRKDSIRGKVRSDKEAKGRARWISQ